MSQRVVTQMSRSISLTEDKYEKIESEKMDSAAQEKFAGINPQNAPTFTRKLFKEGDEEGPIDVQDIVRVAQKYYDKKERQD